MSKRLRTILTILFTSAITYPLAVVSQDIHYSHITFSPIYANPAFTGYFNGNLRMYANYRNQFYTIMGSSSFQTYSASADISQPVGLWGEDFIGGGVYLFHDRVGDPEKGGQFQTSAATVTASYSKALGADWTHALTIGMMGTFMQRRFTGDLYLFGSQYNPLTGDIFPNPPPSEITPGERINFMTADFGFGLIYLGKVGRKANLFSGLAVAHIVEPRWSFLDKEDGVTLPTRISAQLGVDIETSARMNNSLSVFFQQQGSTAEVVLGNLIDYRIIQESYFKTDLLLGTYLRTLHSSYQPLSIQSFILMVGMEYNDFRFAFSYDAQFADLRGVTKSNSALEVSIRFLATWYKEKTITRHCPRI